MKKQIIVLLTFLIIFNVNKSFGQLQGFDLLNVPVDVSEDFKSFENTFYFADSLSNFDPKTASGQIVYRRYGYSTRQAFDNILAGLNPVRANEFPTLALMDAGVPSIKPVSGVAMGLMTREKNGKQEYELLTDILGLEDFSGETGKGISYACRAGTC